MIQAKVLYQGEMIDGSCSLFFRIADENSLRHIMHSKLHSLDNSKSIFIGYLFGLLSKYSKFFCG